MPCPELVYRFGTDALQRFSKRMTPDERKLVLLDPRVGKYQTLTPLSLLTCSVGVARGGCYCSHAHGQDGRSGGSGYVHPQ